MTPWAAPLSYRVYPPLGIRCILVRGTGPGRTWSSSERHPSWPAFHLPSSLHGVKASSPPTIPQTLGLGPSRGIQNGNRGRARSDLPRVSDSHPSFVPGHFNWMSCATGPRVSCSSIVTTRIVPASDVAPFPRRIDVYPSNPFSSNPVVRCLLFVARNSRNRGRWMGNLFGGRGWWDDEKWIRNLARSCYIYIFVEIFDLGKRFFDCLRI